MNLSNLRSILETKLDKKQGQNSYLVTLRKALCGFGTKFRTWSQSLDSNKDFKFI